MKKSILLLTLLFAATTLFAQSDDDLFGGDDEFFFGGDDDLFFDDGIDVIENVAASSDLSKGVLFENGSVKIGGMLETSLGVQTTLFADNDKTFGDYIKETTLTPTASAFFTVDARPNQNLRMFTKFGMAYPYKTTAASGAITTERPLFGSLKIYETTVTTTVSDYLLVKELFTDFSAADRAFFRFGIHTVTWGTGIFFSPVSDLINVTSIDPENTDKQVDGCFNLRTQITFPDSQNCLWLYVIPSTNFVNAGTTEAYVRETALAAKTDLVFGGWEFGLGGFYKYENAPKAMLTASGSFKKISLFGEMVYQYGGSSEWIQNSDWDNKTSIFQATAGFSYFWKDPSIALAGQYYFDGNTVDKLIDIKENILISGSIPRITQGHNIAMLATFGRIFGTTDFSAVVFGMMNFGRDEITLKDSTGTYTQQIEEAKALFNTLTFSAMFSYKPINEITITAGPYFTLQDFDSKPNVSLRLNFTLGGGKF